MAEHRLLAPVDQVYTQKPPLLQVGWLAGHWPLLVHTLQCPLRQTNAKDALWPHEDVCEQDARPCL
jgi:hypothetical protein